MSVTSRVVVSLAGTLALGVAVAALAAVTQPRDGCGHTHLELVSTHPYGPQHTGQRWVRVDDYGYVCESAGGRP